MRFRAGLTLVLASILFSLASTARAEQTRDFMIAAPENGTFGFIDLVFPGMQAGIDVARGPEEWTFYIQMGSGWGL